MRSSLILCVLATALATCPFASGGVCSFDAAPAATLLFPFVVFDYANPDDGASTMLYITNTGPDAVIVHVEVYSSLGWAQLGFNIVLSGYDVETISMRQLLRDGLRPITGTAGGLLVEGSVQELGPVGAASPLAMPEGTDGVFSGCMPTNPTYPDDDPIPQETLDTIEFYLTYVQYLGDYDALFHWDCVDANSDGYIADDVFQLAPDDWFQGRRTSQPARMYITADVVQRCNSLFPDSPQYWNQDMVSYDNVLMGEAVWTVHSTGELERELAVHIEADPQIWERVAWSDYGAPLTFYWPDTWNLVGPDSYPSPDRREPLPTAWALHFEGAGGAPGETRLRVWKTWADMYTVADPDESFHGYAAMDCIAYTYYAWDDDENVVYGVGGPPAPYQPNLLPLVTQEVSVDEFHVPDSRGWMLFQWPRTNAATNTDYYQAWMATRYQPGPGPFDTNGDGELNGDDVAWMAEVIFDPEPPWGLPGPTDLDGNGTLDAGDLALLLARGFSPPDTATRAGTVMANFNCGD